MFDQIIVFLIIISVLVLFIIGRIRYDFIALLGLLALTIFGVLDPGDTFEGFSHPAIITVAAVLVISAALVKTGVIDAIVHLLNRKTPSNRIIMAKLMLVTAILSGFMNNIGALALVLPVAIKISREKKFPPSQILMPLAFSALLGGMMTEIGTPPNLIVSSYRISTGAEGFSFFDFAPVGLTVSILGILFMATFGRKLIPNRESQGIEKSFNIGEYLSEVQVVKNSKLIGRTIIDINKVYNLEVEILSIIRSDQKIIAPSPLEVLSEDDILIIKTIPVGLADLIDKTGIKLKGARKHLELEESLIKSRDMDLVEVVLRDDSPLVGRTAFETKLRNRYSVNLVALSRKGVYSVERLKSLRFKAGDVLLIQAPTAVLKDIYNKMGCLPLAERGVEIVTDRAVWKMYFTIGVFLMSIILTTLGVFPVQVSFSLAAITLVLSKIITPREFYDAIEWPSIIMLGSLIPLGIALSQSGGADTIASFLFRVSGFIPPGFMVALMMVLTLGLANLISTSATAVLMGPIAISLSQVLGVSPDPYLMGVGIAASAAFLTPIGHQTNMLVMGPAGYKFTDYWKLGLPLSIILIVVATPLILFIWPL